LDEGEITLPLLVEALERVKLREYPRWGEKPDVTSTPIPRYDLLTSKPSDMSCSFREAARSSASSATS